MPSYFSIAWDNYVNWLKHCELCLGLWHFFLKNKVPSQAVGAVWVKEGCLVRWQNSSLVYKIL